MKNTHIAVALAATALTINSMLAASTTIGFEDVTSNFYTNTLGWNDIGYDYASSSAGGVTASIEYMYYYNGQYNNYTGGGAIANSKTTITEYTNNVDTVTGGASSGNNYAIFYLPLAYNGTIYYTYDYSISSDKIGILDATTALDAKNSSFDKTLSVGETGGDFLNYTSVIFSQKVEMQSVDLSMTALLHYYLDSYGADDDAYMDNETIHTKEDGYMFLRIYGILDAEAGLVTDKYVDWKMAEYVNGTNDYLADSWEKISLSDLGEVEGLAFQLVSNFTNSYGMTAPSYFALDNLTFAAIPEPNTYAAIFGALALAFACRRKNSKK